MLLGNIYSFMSSYYSFNYIFPGFITSPLQQSPILDRYLIFSSVCLSVLPYSAIQGSCLLLSEVSLRFHCSTSCFTYLPHRRVGATLFTRNNHIQCKNSWIPDPGGYGCRPQNAKCISRCTVSPRKKKFLQANGVCHVDRLYSFIGSNSRTNLA